MRVINSPVDSTLYSYGLQGILSTVPGSSLPIKAFPVASSNVELTHADLHVKYIVPVSVLCTNSGSPCSLRDTKGSPLLFREVFVLIILTIMFGIYFMAPGIGYRNLGRGLKRN